MTDILILGGSCLLFLVTGIVLLIKNYNFVKGAKKTSGQIAEVSEYTDTSNGRMRTMYSSVIEYYTERNVKVRFKNPSSSSLKPTVGKAVEVYYYEEKPENAKIASVFNLYIMPVILIALGLVLVAALVAVSGN